MTIQIPLSPDTEAVLKERADACGMGVAEYLAQIVSRIAEPPIPLGELSGPIASSFAFTGMTDDQLGDLPEQSKHELRSRWRSRPTS